MPVGAACAWHTLDAAASTRELEAAAAASRVALRIDRRDRNDAALPLHVGLDETLSVLGGVVFTCCGRGSGFHGGPDRDSAALRAGRPGLPLAGVFCNGEIGAGRRWNECSTPVEDARCRSAALQRGRRRRRGQGRRARRRLHVLLGDPAAGRRRRGGARGGVVSK